jgi:hypothetical protein
MSFKQLMAKKDKASERLLKFSDAVHATIHSKQVTDKEINDCMARWLRNSTDRNGGRKLRVPIKSRQNNDGNTTPDKEPSNTEGSQEISN